jgi:hypothetical protein
MTSPYVHCWFLVILMTVSFLGLVFKNAKNTFKEYYYFSGQRLVLNVHILQASCIGATVKGKSQPPAHGMSTLQGPL